MYGDEFALLDYFFIFLFYFICNMCFVCLGMQINGSSSFAGWDGSESSLPNTMFLGQQMSQEFMNPFAGNFFNL